MNISTEDKTRFREIIQPAIDEFLLTIECIMRYELINEVEKETPFNIEDVIARTMNRVNQ